MNTSAKQNEMRKLIIHITNHLEELKPLTFTTLSGYAEMQHISDEIRSATNSLWQFIDDVTHLDEIRDVQRSVIMRLNDLMDDIEGTGNQNYTSVVKLLDLVKTDLESRRPDGTIDFDMTNLLIGQLEQQAEQSSLNANPVEPAQEAEPAHEAVLDIRSDVPFPMQIDSTGRKYVAFVDSTSDTPLSLMRDFYNTWLYLRQGKKAISLDRRTIIKLLPYLTNFAETGYMDCATAQDVNEMYGD